MLGGVVQVWGLPCWSLCQEKTVSSTIRVSTRRATEPPIVATQGTLLLPAAHLGALKETGPSPVSFELDCTYYLQQLANHSHPGVPNHTATLLFSPFPQSSTGTTSLARPRRVVMVQPHTTISKASRHERTLTKTSGKLSKSQEAVHRGQVRRRRARSVSKSSRRYYCDSKRRAGSTVTKLYT